MFSNMPPVTKALLIANGLVFLLQSVLGNAMFVPFMLWPLGGGGADLLAAGNSMAPGFMPWQLLTYAFLHGSLAPVPFNMLALFIFGAPLKYPGGNRRFLAYYLVCVVGAGLCQLLVAWWMSNATG